MIKINLLDSVTTRTRAVVAVEQKVSSPRTQTLMIALVVATLMVVTMAYDFYSSRAERDAAQKELEHQQQIQAQMAAVNKERAELEKKTKDIEVRIEAIKKLRASQQGPGEVLREIKQRIDSIPGIYLESIEQKGSDLVVKGGSPNEASVARFGQSLEFSSGLFNNLSIETQRKELAPPAPGGNQTAQGNTPAASDQSELVVPKTEIVNFTIKCAYAPGSSNNRPPSGGTQNTAAAPPANQVAKK